MDSLKIYTQSDIDALTSRRSGETRMGEMVHAIPSLNALSAVPAQFVLVGIPEDIGVRANNGTGGTATIWQPAIGAFLSAQSNEFLRGNNVAILGHFDVLEPVNGSAAVLRTKVSLIDELVSPVIKQIVAAGKTPIIIGGGHNNAFPIIAGVSAGLNKMINAINIDAHADLRPVNDGRHSGNGFSAAIAQGYLNEYAVFGLHESYNNQHILDTISTNPKIKALFFDSLLREPQSVLDAWHIFTVGMPSPCGLEIDLDSIENMLSSAAGPSGFALNDIRKIILSTEKKFAWFHICEGAVHMADGRESTDTAKAIAYLISDFIKSQARLS